MIESGMTSHSFKVRFELVFERNTALHSGFSRGINAHLFPIGLFK
jgi:hypothetical protein